MEDLSNIRQSMDAAIHHARKGNLKFFKDASLDILMKARDDGATVLSIVVIHNHVECCKEICERCPSLLCSQHYKEGQNPLHYAAYRGYLDILKILISTCHEAEFKNQHEIEGQGGDRADRQKTMKLSSTTHSGSNAMHSAVFGHNPESIKLLIAADPNKELLRARDIQNNTPLHCAVEQNQLEIVRLLIEADTDFPYGANSSGLNPLLLAEMQNNREMLKLILELQPNQSKVSVNENGWTTLHYCVYEGYSRAIECIIQSCPESIKVVDNDGQNFFHHAVNKLGNLKMVEEILRMKEITEEVLNSTDKLGRTPFNVAAESQNISMIDCLYDDPRVNKKLLVTKNLNWVVEKHNIEILELFMRENDDFLINIEEEVFLKSKNEEDETILFKAAEEDKPILCEKLCKRCHSLIYHQSRGGHTALHHAILRGSLIVVLSVLIKAGSAEFLSETARNHLLTIVDDQGDTALHKAVRNSLLRAVEDLIEAYPDYEYGANNSGYTPIALSIKIARSNENKFDSVKIRWLLFKMQPRQTVKHRGEKGWTSLLHQATYEEDLSIIEDIIECCTKYFDLVPVDNNGKSFLHIAVELGKIEVVRLVLGATDISTSCLEQLDNEGKNFLHIAAELGNVAVVRLVLRAKDIIKLKSCLEQLDNEGKNFLRIAAELGNVAVVRLVLRAKDIINLTNCLEQVDNEGKNFLHIAAELGNVAVVRLVLRDKNDIIKLKSCLKQVDHEGKNFLHIAAEFEKVEIVKQVLREKDISKDGVLNEKDNDGNTPFHIAALTGNEPLTRCFLFHPEVGKDTKNKKGHHVLSEINFPYDKRKAGVVGVSHTVDQSDLKDQSDFDLVVGALIATVSFAAGITVPGGYISDGPNQGKAVFSKEVSFAAFTISNTFALVFSLFAVFSHFFARRLTWDADIICLLNVAKFCTLAAMYCMMAAFIAGSFAILAKSNWLAIVVCIISCLFFIFGCGPLWMWIIGMRSKLPASELIWIWVKTCFGLANIGNASVEEGGNASVEPRA